MASKFHNHIVKVPNEESVCLGCESCELLCGFVRDGLTGRRRGGIHVKRDSLRGMIHTILVCEQCADHPCYKSCPLQDEAMCVDDAGTVYIVEENCIGCGLCARACQLEPTRIAMVKTQSGKKARKCDMCRTRPGGPVCIEHCPALCLVQSEDATAEEVSA